MREDHHKNWGTENDGCCITNWESGKTNKDASDSQATN